MKQLRLGHGARRRAPWRYFLLLLAGLLIVGPLAACSSANGGGTACTGDVEDYQGRCVTHVTAKYLACIEGRGFSVTNQIGGGVTLPAVADSTFNVAYSHSKEENTPVALQIVHDCLALAEKNATSGDDRGVAHDYVRQTTRYIGVVKNRLAAIELEPSGALDCGSADIGGTAVPCPENITIKSTGVKALKTANMEVKGANRDDFQAGDECSNKTLEPDQTCTMTVQFRPSDAGERNALLVVHQNLPKPDTGTPLHLVGTGTGTGAPGAEHTLTVTVDSSAAPGRVISAPARLDCGDTCSATFEDGTDVTLTATYDQGSGHVAWGTTDCDTFDGDNCVIHLTADRTITATLSP